MTTNHAAEAVDFLAAGRDYDLRKAHVHATLALTEQVRISNLIALGQVTLGPDCSPVMLGAVWPGGELRPEIKEGLGL